MSKIILSRDYQEVWYTCKKCNKDFVWYHADLEEEAECPYCKGMDICYTSSKSYK